MWLFTWEWGLAVAERGDGNRDINFESIGWKLGKKRQCRNGVYRRGKAIAISTAPLFPNQSLHYDL
jgi:hypothetical protein